jgi:acetyl-CoA carboxylase biotin carboxylase subunit
VWGETRQEALEKMQWALNHYVVLGVKNNISFLQRLFQHPQFQAGKLHTHFLQEYPLTVEDTLPTEAILAAAWAAQQKTGHAANSGSRHSESLESSPFEALGAWRGSI